MLCEAARHINTDDISWPTLKSFLTGAKCDITTHIPEQWMRSLLEIKKSLAKESNDESGGDYADGYDIDSMESEDEYEEEDEYVGNSESHWKPCV